MSISAYEWRLMKSLDESASRIGMKVLPSKRGGDFLCLSPNDNLLPSYSRDAELAVGTAEHLSSVIQGWEIAVTSSTGRASFFLMGSESCRAFARASLRSGASAARAGTIVRARAGAGARLPLSSFFLC